MSHNLFYRNVRARDHLELFLISAVSALLLLRFYLSVTGYPQLGGGTLHIAHMLWGGILMTAAIVLILSFLGARIQRLAALLGGVGFGIFIDELGKFITKDNNYFFRPTIGIIYAIFIILYLVFNFLARDEKLTSKEYELNALAQFEEIVLVDLDTAEKQRIRDLLQLADKHSVIAQKLADLLQKIDALPARRPGRLSRLLAAIDRQYVRLISMSRAGGLIGGLFILETGIFVIVILATLFNNLDSATDLLHLATYNDVLLAGQLVASIASGIFVLVGAVKLATSRMEAFEMFRRATLVNIFLTEFFIFSRIQFGAIPGLLVNLVLLFALHYAIEAEQRVFAKQLTSG